jgi:NAD(P)-dependent dehydrogenase (short-subunit alcohol dehydrogenase family)
MDFNLNDKVALVTGGSKGIAQFLDENCPHIELKRPGRIEEVGALVAFPASEPRLLTEPTTAWTAARWPRCNRSPDL